MVTVRKSRQQALELEVQRFQQGGRFAYSLIMDLGTLDSNVPNFVNTERIDKANRRFNPTHSDRIADYIYDIDDWVLGAIVLGIDPEGVEYFPFQDGDGNDSESLGYIWIPLDGGTSSIMILDGQHRRMAIKTVRDRLRQEIQSVKESSSNNGREKSLQKLEIKFRSLNEMAIPVVIFEEANVKNLRRMFADLAQTRNIDAVTKTRFDDRDPFNRAAVELVELGRSVLLEGRVEMERSTPGRLSNSLLSVNQLARCLKVLNYGYRGRASRARILEAQSNYEELIDLGIAWADDFLPSARKEYDELCSIELEEDFVANNRSNFSAYNVTVLQMLADCYYRWNEYGRPVEELASWLRQADFDLNSDDCIFRQTDMVTAGKPTLVSRWREINATIEYIVEQAILANS